MAREMTVSTMYGTAIVTTDHPASGRGLPVVVIDGEAYGPTEIGPINMASYGLEDAEKSMHQALHDAGYEVYA